MSGFDPYLIWLDIPPHERPATHYRLLGLRPLEKDSQVIAEAAQRVISHVSRFQQTEHAAACNQLLAELTAARDCLLNPARKQAYDAGMSQSITASQPAATARPLPLPNQPARVSGERPLPSPSHPGAGAGVGGSPEQPLPSAPQLPSTGERQISQSPPVPSAPVQSPATQPNQTPTALPNQAPLQTQPHTPSPPAGEVALGNPGGVPQSVQPIASPGVPQTASQPQSAQPGSLPASPTPAQMPTQAPTNEAVQPPSPQPSPVQTPAWASAERTGEVETVVAGQSSPSVDRSRTQRGRQLRRAQQTQSAYMLFGIAMAMIVFFFGAILLLAIFLGNQ